jgi:hypothetical protein
VRAAEPPPCEAGLGLERVRFVCDDKLHLIEPAGQAPCPSREGVLPGVPPRRLPALPGDCGGRERRHERIELRGTFLVRHSMAPHRGDTRAQMEYDEDIQGLGHRWDLPRSTAGALMLCIDQASARGFAWGLRDNSGASG